MVRDRWQEGRSKGLMPCRILRILAHNIDKRKRIIFGVRGGGGGGGGGGERGG
jgi:hypothetical protein